MLFHPTEFPIEVTNISLPGGPDNLGIMFNVWSAGPEQTAKYTVYNIISGLHRESDCSEQCPYDTMDTIERYTSFDFQMTSKTRTEIEDDLLNASLGGFTWMVRQILAIDKTIAVSARGHKTRITALMNACLKGQIEVTRQLLKAGTSIINAYSANGMTALHNAARKGHRVICELLIEYGSFVDTVCNNGNTPLFLAVKGEHLDVVKVLLHHHANANLC